MPKLAAGRPLRRQPIVALALVLALGATALLVSGKPPVLGQSDRASLLYLPIGLRSGHLRDGPPAIPTLPPSPGTRVRPTEPPLPPPVIPTEVPTVSPSPHPTQKSPEHDAPGLYGVTSDLAWLRSSGDDGSDSWQFHFAHDRTAFGYALPVAGDWNGDGFDSLALYDLRSGRLRLSNQNLEDAPGITLDLGLTYHLPLAGDWDGDGIDGFGLLDPRSGWLSLWQRANSVRPDVQVQVDLPDLPPAGEDGDLGLRPLAGDWDGDGADSPALFELRSGSLWIWETPSGGAADRVVETDLDGQWPVAGDWSWGDARGDSIGGYSAADARFTLLEHLAADSPRHHRTMGSEAAVWLPLAGHWADRPPSTAPPGFDWPTADPSEVGLDPAGIAAAYARAERVPNLRALLVLRQDKLAAERYWRGVDASMAGCVKSVSKSVLSALVGIAIADGHLQGLDEPVASHLPDEFMPAPLNRIAIRHLLTMSAGLAWEEPGSSLGGMIRSQDWVGHVAGLERVDDPGARWNYSTGLTHVASAMLGEATGESSADYARRRLFDPIGIRPTRWDLDPEGVPMGGAEVWMRPRDMLRFGQLYLNGGLVDGQRILPADWVQASTRAQLPAYGPYDYGGWWWMRQFGDQPVYFAWGYAGQFIFVLPGLDMVVVATSNWWLGNPNATHEGIFEILGDHLIPAASP